MNRFTVEETNLMSIYSEGGNLYLITTVCCIHDYNRVYNSRT